MKRILELNHTEARQYLLKVSERTILRQIQTFSDKLKNAYSKDFTISSELKNIIFSDKFRQRK